MSRRSGARVAGHVKVAQFELAQRRMTLLRRRARMGRSTGSWAEVHIDSEIRAVEESIRAGARMARAAGEG